MNLLLITTPDQQPFLARFSRLQELVGHPVRVLLGCPDTLSSLENVCKKADIGGLICANQTLLTKVLGATLDFKEPTGRKALTLDDYQGSLLSMKGIPTVVINPPEHINTVSYGKFIAERFLRKITKPESWFPQTKFDWSVANENSIDRLYREFQDCKYIAIDIETPLDNPHLFINCVSFTAYWPRTHHTHSLVLPCDSLFWLTWIRKFCNLPQPKILQGGTYDALYLLRWNCPIRNWLFDTLNLMHCWYSELPKRLDFVGAFALRNIRYWKDDGKSGNLEDYYRYNAMDGWATLNSFLSLVSECPPWAITNYLQEFPINFPALHCELEGWKIDPERFKQVREKMEVDIESKRASLRRMLRAPNFNPNSPAQVLKLFKILGCGDLTSTDKINIARAEFRHPLNARILGLVKEIKQDVKSLGTYLDESKLPGWRLHYRINSAGTDTERTAASESSFWIGFQIQNIKRGGTIKQCFVSDTGWLLSEPDLKQSEAYCVGYSSGCIKLLGLLESGRDYHTWHIQEFFGIPYETAWDTNAGKIRPEFAPLRDDVSKRVNHGANYNMTEGVLLDTMTPREVAKAKVLLKLPAEWSLKRCCKHLLDLYHVKTYPELKGQYYPWIKAQVDATRKLVSPTGHTRWFFGSMDVRHYMNSAIAHVSQTLSARIANLGFYAVWHRQIYGDFSGHLRIKALIHDSVPYQYRIGSEWVNEEVRKTMTIPTKVKDIKGVERTMTISVGMKTGGQRWSELK